MYKIYTVTKNNEKFYYKNNSYVGEEHKCDCKFCTYSKRLSYNFTENKLEAESFYNINLARVYLNMFNNPDKQPGVPLWIHGNQFKIE